MKYSKVSKKWTPEKIDIQRGLQGEQLRKTLVHEMCHVWAVKHHQETGHGKYFWKKMRECGYPDGHRFLEGKNDAWVRAKDFVNVLELDLRHYTFFIFFGLVLS